jgi:ATP-dependent Lon protease
VLPHENEPDLGELPPEARKELQFILVDSIEEVLAVAFEKPGPVRAEPAPRPERQAALPA